MNVVLDEDQQIEDKQPVVQESSILGTCRTCGSSFEPYLRGSVKMWSLCPSCLKTKIEKSNETRHIKLTVDFSRDSDLFSGLQEYALRQRRTVENQILVVLERAMKEERADGC